MTTTLSLGREFVWLSEGLATKTRLRYKFATPDGVLLTEKSAEEEKDGVESADFYHVFITPTRFGA